MTGGHESASIPETIGGDNPGPYAGRLPVQSHGIDYMPGRDPERTALLDQIIADTVSPSPPDDAPPVVAGPRRSYWRVQRLDLDDKVSDSQVLSHRPAVDRLVTVWLTFPTTTAVRVSRTAEPVAWIETELHSTATP